MNTIQEFLSQTPVDETTVTIQYIEGLSNIIDILRAVADFRVAKKATEMISNYLKKAQEDHPLIFEREPDAQMATLITQPIKAPVVILYDSVRPKPQQTAEPIVCCLIQVNFETEALKRVVKPLVLGLGLDVASRRLYSVGISTQIDLSDKIQIG